MSEKWINQTQSNKQKEMQSKRQKEQRPSTYLGLIQKVGGFGKYQYFLTVVIALVWYATGIILMSTSFLFLNPDFDCQALGLLSEDCYDYVCALPKQQWADFVTKEANSFKSLANSFGDYFCDDEIYLNLYACSSYVGAFVGYNFVAFYADNYGRRMTSIISWGICCVGCLILMLSQTIWMASIGLFFCGFGSDSVVNVTATLITEQYNDLIRQKCYSIIQGTFTLGGLFITGVYFIWQDWFIASAYFLFIPSLITLAGFIFFVKESPLYLVRASPQNALKELNDIGRMNTGDPQILTMQDIENVMECQQSKEFQQNSTPIDVFRYRSLRTPTILQGIASISTYLMYYGPTLIVGQFGFDVYTSTLILMVADLLTYYPLMLIIDKIKRRKGCMILFGSASFISGILIFLVKPEGCDLCPVIFIQLALIFIFRFQISMVFALSLVYQSEIYPTRIRNISIGVLGSFGTIASSTAPILMGVITRANINNFIIFTIMGIVATSCCSLSPQTFGKLCPEEIEEIEYLKVKRSAAKKLMKATEKLHKN